MYINSNLRKRIIIIVFVLRIDSYQSVLDISTKLSPIEGKISIFSIDSNIQMEINGSSSYIHGGVISNYKELKPVDNNIQELSLFPGEYKIRFWKKNYEKEITLTVKKGSNIQLEISIDKEDNSFIIEGI